MHTLQSNEPRAVSVTLGLLLPLACCGVPSSLQRRTDGTSYPRSKLHRGTILGVLLVRVGRSARRFSPDRATIGRRSRRDRPTRPKSGRRDGTRLANDDHVLRTVRCRWWRLRTRRWRLTIPGDVSSKAHGYTGWAQKTSRETPFSSLRIGPGGLGLSECSCSRERNIDFSSIIASEFAWSLPRTNSHISRFVFLTIRLLT